MPNDFSGDANCVALYKMENLAPEVDSIGGNTMTGKSNMGSDIVNFKEGLASATFIGGGGYMTLNDASLDAAFPLKNGSGNSLISICHWVYFDTLPAFGHWKGAITKWNATSNGQSFWLHTGTDSERKYQIGMGYNGGVSTEVSALFGTAVVIGRWYHVGMTLNGITGAYRIRVWDDTAQAFLDSDLTGTFVNAPMYLSTWAWQIGRYTTYAHQGKMDEVVIFNRILSTDEIDAIRGGTFPVGGVSPGDPIGGSYPGPEKALNPRFKDWTADDPDDWTVTEVGDATSKVTKSPVGYARVISDGAAASMSNDGAVPVVGKKYKAKVDVSTRSLDPDLTVTFGGLTSGVVQASGIIEVEGIATTTAPLTITSSDPGDFEVAQVSFYEIVPLVAGEPTGDVIFAALVAYPGTLDDKLLAFYKANGATSNDLQDAEREFLIASGVTGTGHNQELWVEYILTLTPPASIVTYQDLWNWYWANL